jgi:hypothetical protein
MKRQAMPESSTQPHDLLAEPLAYRSWSPCWFASAYYCGRARKLWAGEPETRRIERKSSIHKVLYAMSSEGVFGTVTFAVGPVIQSLKPTRAGSE